MAGISLSAILLGGTFMGITALGLMAARELPVDRSQRAIGLMTASFASGQLIFRRVSFFKLIAGPDESIDTTAPA
jgi:hypothetical protein